LPPWGRPSHTPQTACADWLHTSQAGSVEREDDRYGSLPTVTYFESPVIVDNATGDIITDG
jgi:hypothetical protein